MPDTVFVMRAIRYGTWWAVIIRGNAFAWQINFVASNVVTQLPGWLTQLANPFLMLASRLEHAQ